MNGKVNYVLVGAFVVALGAALVAAVLWLSAGGPPKPRDLYVVYMSESVAGLGVDAPVKYMGVDVGRVKEIGLAPEDPQKVRLLLELDKGTPVKEDTRATLILRGLTGLANVNLEGGSADAPPLRAREGEPYPVIKSKPSLASRLEERLSNLIDGLTEGLQRLNTVLDEDNRRALAETLANVRSLTSTLSARSETITAALDDAAAALHDARGATARLEPLVGQMHSSAEAMENMADEIAAAGSALREMMEASGSDLQRFTRRSLPQAEVMVFELRRTAEHLRRVSERLERDPSVLIYGAPPPQPGPGEE